MNINYEFKIQEDYINGFARYNCEINGVVGFALLESGTKVLADTNSTWEGDE